MGDARSRDAVAGDEEWNAKVRELLVPELTDDEWDAKESQVERERQRAAELEAEQERATRAATLLAFGAPRVALDLALSGDFDASWPAAAAIRFWPGHGVRALAGPVRCGKTTSALAWLLKNGGRSPMFARAASLERRGRYDRTLMAKWEQATALLLDDLGTEVLDQRGTFLALLDELVDVYYGDRRALIITTNLLPAQVAERYGARVASRIGERGWCLIAAGGPLPDGGDR